MQSRLTFGRARRLRLVSGINGVEAIVPLDYRAEELQSFVSSRKDWIIKTSQYYSRLKERCGGIEPGTVYFLGSKYHFHHVKDKKKSAAVFGAMNGLIFH